MSRNWWLISTLPLTWSSPRTALQLVDGFRSALLEPLSQREDLPFRRRRQAIQLVAG